MAFFPALGIDGFIGPFGTETAPAYKDVTNVGQAYDNVTGRLATTCRHRLDRSMTPSLWRVPQRPRAFCFCCDAGVFTAPLRGAYCFRYTACGQPYSRAIGVRLYKNAQSIMYTSEGSDSDGGLEYVSNAAVLELEAGDVVYLCLPASLQLFDSSYNRNTFSGFLLFTM